MSLCISSWRVKLFQIVLVALFVLGRERKMGEMERMPFSSSIFEETLI